ncbi:MAG: hypothetical protein ABJA67_14295 [Chthonomonadales bacterium]
MPTQFGYFPTLPNVSLDDLARRYREANKVYTWTLIAGLCCLWPIWFVTYMEYNKMNDIKRDVAAMGIDVDAWVRSVK